MDRIRRIVFAAAIGSGLIAPLVGFGVIEPIFQSVTLDYTAMGLWLVLCGVLGIFPPQPPTKE